MYLHVFAPLFFSVPASRRWIPLSEGPVGRFASDLLRACFQPVTSTLLTCWKFASDLLRPKAPFYRVKPALKYTRCLSGFKVSAAKTGRLKVGVNLISLVAWSARCTTLKRSA